ncbi:MAG: hypothetical protein KBD76_07610 [Bacteriovorax sp.]|nr:hypothetical protein [Bacteriovorax sp.]
MKIFLSVLGLLLFLDFQGCSKKSQIPVEKYTVEEFDALASGATLNKEKSDTPQFADYSPGVNRLESKSLVYKRLAFFAIAFDSAEQAREEAMRLNQYYARNWLFDRVQGEPVLEDYVIETFKAINPNKKIQRIPKKTEHGHGSGHGESHPPAEHH